MTDPTRYRGPRGPSRGLHSAKQHSKILGSLERRNRKGAGRNDGHRGYWAAPSNRGQQGGDIAQVWRWHGQSRRMQQLQFGGPQQRRSARNISWTG
eukprot:4287569-Pyramimonas_sp.AAC.1